MGILLLALVIREFLFVILWRFSVVLIVLVTIHHALLDKANNSVYMILKGPLIW
jgi:hypothetical protein